MIVQVGAFLLAEPTSRSETCDPSHWVSFVLPLVGRRMAAEVCCPGNAPLVIFMGTPDHKTWRDMTGITTLSLSRQKKKKEGSEHGD